MSVTWPFVTRVGSTTTPAGSTSAALTVPHTTGNQLVVGIVYQSSGTVTSFTDTAGNTYTQCGSQITDGGPNKVQMWRAWNITGNAANIVTAHLGSSTFGFVAIAVLELTMVGTSDPLQNTAGTNGSGTAASSGSVTVTGNAAIVGMAVMNTSGTFRGVSPTAAFPFSTVNGASTSGQFLGSTLQLTTASAAAQLAQTVAATWAILAVSVTIPGAAGGGGTGGAWAYA